MYSSAKPERAISYLLELDTSGVRETLYTCPDNCRSRMVLLYVANANGTVSIVLEWYRASDNKHYYIIGGKNLSSGDYIQLSDSYIVLHPGDKIEVTATGATVVVDSFCTVEETFLPNQ